MCLSANYVTQKDGWIVIVPVLQHHLQNGECTTWDVNQNHIRIFIRSFVTPTNASVYSRRGRRQHSKQYRPPYLTLSNLNNRLETSDADYAGILAYVLKISTSLSAISRAQLFSMRYFKYVKIEWIENEKSCTHEITTKSFHDDAIRHSQCVKIERTENEKSCTHE